MGDLVAFLRARLDEDEQWALLTAAATAAQEVRPWRFDREDVFAEGGERMAVARSKSVAPHIARHDPFRVLRDVEADRKLLAEYQQAEAKRPHDDAEYAHGYADGLADGLLLAVKIRAARFSDHPDYADAVGEQPS